MPLNLAQQRLQTQGLVRSRFQNTSEVVAWLGAMQAQDYPGAKWAIGLRMPPATDAALDEAYNAGTILRTHVLRPTWHFVVPADIRWMLALTASRIHALNAYSYRKFELDEATLARCHKMMIKELEGGKALTRVEIMAALETIGIVASELRASYIMMHAEVEGLICSGPRKGKQFTYALLEERVPPAKSLSHEEALAELTRRYFTGHGPATIQDFVWWSGLTVADAKSGLDSVKSELVHETLDDRTFWWSPETPTMDVQKAPPTVYLLPNYDELLLSYQEGSRIAGTDDYIQAIDRGDVLSHTLMIDERIAGTWKRTIQKGRADLVAKPFHALSNDEQQAFAAAAEQYGAFLGAKVTFAIEDGA